MKKTIFEEMGGTYIRQGYYFIPSFVLPEEEQRFMGIWEQRSENEFYVLHKFYTTFTAFRLTM